MSTIAGNTFSSPKNINLKSGILRFGATKSSNPLSNDSTGYGLYVDSSGNLKFWDGSSSITVGASGGSSVPTWETIFAADATFTMTPDNTFTIAGNRSTATDVLEITNIAGGSGNVVQITNSGSGDDIAGTSDTWNISKAGLITCVGLTSTSDFTTTSAAVDWDLVDNNASALSFDTSGKAGLLVLVTTDNSEGVTMSGTCTVSGQLLVGVGSNTVVSLIVQDDAITTFGNGSTEDEGMIVFSSDTIDTGNLLRLQLDESALAGGHFLKCVQTDAAADVWSVGEDGITTIAGAAGSNMLIVTVGDVSVADGSLTLVDADNAPTLSVTNDTATTSDVVLIDGSGTFTGTGSSAFVQIVQSGLTTGDCVSITVDAMNTGTALLLDSSGTLTTTGAMLEILADSATTAAGLVRISADGLTSGNVISITCTAGNALTSGELMTLDHTSGDITGTLNKTGNLTSIASSRTVTTGTVADNYDMLALTRTSVINGAGAHTAAGSVARIENAVTNTSGTVADTVKGLEIVMDSLGTGDGIEITHAATGGIALNVIGAATSVDDVLIATTGVKASNKGALQITNSGATAAGGSVLRVINSGTPAASTSYLVDFDYTGATFTNNPDAVYIASDGTGRALHITDAGLKTVSLPNVDIESTNAGAVGAVLRLSHQGGSQAASDVLGQIVFLGEDDAAADNIYGLIESVVVASSAGSERGRLDFSAGDAGGGVTLAARIDHDGSNGILSAGDGAASGIISSIGNFDLQLQTGNSTTGNITIADGADGAITLTPNGTGAVDIAGKLLHSETTTSTGAGAVAITGTVHEITTSATGDAMTLANGTEGQILHIVYAAETAGGDTAILTPTSFNDSTITFTDLGESVTLLYTAAKWYVIGNGGATIA